MFYQTNKKVPDNKGMLSMKRQINIILILSMVMLMSGCEAGNKDGSAQPPATVTPGSSPAPTEKPASASQTTAIAPGGQPAPEVSQSWERMKTGEKVKVRGLYLTGWTAGNKEKLDTFIGLADETEINAFVIDVKNDDGIVSYESAVEDVKESKVWERKYDPGTLVDKLHAHGIYVIGRVVCFLDPAFSQKNPDRAIKNRNGGIWREEKKDEVITWLNPVDKRNWGYLADIAREAADKGFDEIQFDYVRFPSADSSKMNFGAEAVIKHEVINEFLSYARKELSDITLSADIFGIVCVSPGDTEGIGQYLELIGKDMDYISPMTYPSLYARGQIVNGIEFPNPDLQPYDVVYNTLLMAKRRLSEAQNYRAQVRPYIQAYTASWLEKGTWQTYGSEQYRQQIQAVLDAGYDEWIFWDSGNQYEKTAFVKE